MYDEFGEEVSKSGVGVGKVKEVSGFEGTKKVIDDSSTDTGDLEKSKKGGKSAGGAGVGKGTKGALVLVGAEEGWGSSRLAELEAKLRHCLTDSQGATKLRALVASYQEEREEQSKASKALFEAIRVFCNASSKESLFPRISNFVGSLDKYVQGLSEEHVTSDRLLRATLSLLQGKPIERIIDGIACSSVNRQSISAFKRYLVWHRQTPVPLDMPSDAKKAAVDENDAFTTVRNDPSDQMKFAGVLTVTGERTAGVTAMAISPADPNILLTASYKTIVVWRLTRESAHRYGVIHKILEGHTGNITDIDISSDGQLAVSSSYDGTLRIWDISTGACILVFENNDNEGCQAASIISVAFAKDDSDNIKYIVAVALDGTVKIWNLQGECVRTMRYKDPDNKDHLFRCSPNAKLVVHVGGDREQDQVKFFDLMEPITKHYFMEASPDGSMCASFDSNKSVLLWDLHNNFKLLHRFDNVGSVRVLAFSRSLSDSWLAAATISSIKIWDVQSKELIQEITMHKEYLLKGMECTKLVWSSDGRELFAGFSDGTVKVYTVGSPTYSLVRIIQELETKYPDFPLSQYLQSSARIELGWCPKPALSSSITCVQIHTEDAEAIDAIADFNANVLDKGKYPQLRLLVYEPVAVFVDEFSVWPDEPILSRGETERLQPCYDWACDNLFSKHSNLVAVTLGFQWLKDNRTWGTTPGIVLVVTQKGFIPLGEDKLPDAIKCESVSAPVYVSEGIASQSSGLANAKIQNVTTALNKFVMPRAKLVAAAEDKNVTPGRLIPGASIGAQLNEENEGCGTLGGFVEDSSGILYGITNQHLFVNGGCPVPTHRRPIPQKGIRVCHPSYQDTYYMPRRDRKEPKAVGKLVCSFAGNIPVDGECKSVWIDAALISIEESSVSMVEVAPTFKNQFVYHTCKPNIVEHQELTEDEYRVVMVSRTRQREGLLKRALISIRYSQKPGKTYSQLPCGDCFVDKDTQMCNYVLGNNSTIISNQYQISFENDIPPVVGDSGSIVYLMEDKDGEETARPLGLYHSGLELRFPRGTAHYGVCSPLSLVLKKLGESLNPYGPPVQLNFRDPSPSAVGESKDDQQMSLLRMKAPS